MSDSAVEIPRIDLRTIHLQLKQLVEKKATREEQLFSVLRLLLGLTNAAGAAYILCDENGQSILGPRILSKQALSWHEQLESILIQEVDKSTQTGQVQIRPLDANRQKWVIATPIDLNTHKEGIVLVLFLGGQPIEMFVTILQLIAGYAVPATANAESQPLWLLSLFSNVLAKTSLEDAYPVLLDSLQAHFECQRIFLGRVRGKHCRLEAVSEMGEVKRESDLIHAIESLMDSALIAAEQAKKEESKSRKSESDTVIGKNFLESKQESTIRALTGAEKVLSLPLNADKKTIAVLILLWSKPPTDSSLSEVKVLATPLGILLDAMRRATPNFFAALFKKSETPLLKRLIIILILVSIIGILSIPYSHKLSGKVVIEPSIRRFVSAQFNGLLKHTVREAGNEVSTGDVLARLDEKEIEWTLSGLTADRNRAKKQKDINAAKKDRAGVQMAQLEIERLDAKIALLNYQANNLEIKSPIDGIVVRGDLKRVEGSPVNKGQTLFEIAPLDSMRVELALVAEDVIYVRHHMPMKIQLEAYPFEQWFLEIDNVHPRSTVRDGDSVFIVEANLDNPDSKLRPGMEGEGEIIADKHPLGWVLFHRVWEKLILWWR